MKNRNVIFTLLILTVLAGAGRFWASSRFDQYTVGLSEHLEAFRFIGETVRDLHSRRSRLSVADTDVGFQTLFTRLSREARLGQVNAEARSGRAGGSAYDDKTWTVKFQDVQGGFSRARIAQFLYNVENEVNRMRATQLELRPYPGDTRSSKGIPFGQDRVDLWEVRNLEFTRRTPKTN